MKRLLAVVGCLAILGGAASRLDAQARFGVQGSWGDDRDLGLGGRVAVSLRSMFPKAPVEFHGSFDYFFPDDPPTTDLAYWELNGNVLYMIPGVRGNVAPYVGGGLNIAHLSADPGGSDTHGGLNLMGGVQFKPRASRVRPFVEFRLELEGGEQFVLAGGVLF